VPPTTFTASSPPSRPVSSASLPGLRMWILSALVFASCLGSLEAYWRSRGFRPTVPDSKDLWYFWRQQVYHDDGKVVVLLGTSRIMADLSLATLEERLPGYRAVQLGLAGEKSSTTLLNDLMADTRFKGVIVCELDTPLLERSRWNDHREFGSYRPGSLMAFCDVIVRSWLGDKLIGLRSPFTLKSLLVRWVLGEAQPQRDRYWMTFRREAPWDFLRVPDLQQVREGNRRNDKSEYARRRFPRWDSLSRDIGEIAALAQRFEERGGRLVFLRAPSTGQRWRLEERYHSKQAGWDRFADRMAAICVHFRDVPAMRACDCPDESHLDFREAPRFTRSLVHELELRGAFR
jgi:hypothetical protein